MMIEMPYVYTLLSCLISSGATPYDAIRKLSETAPPITKTHFQKALVGVKSGFPFSESVQGMYKYKYLRPVARVMDEMNESGVAGVDSLDRLHSDLISQISREANAQIKKLSVKLLFPLVLCVLPSFVFLSVVPVLLNGVMELTF